jgi:hypothetical protein
MNHPHNANASTYAEAANLAAAVSADAKKLDDLCYRMVFETIEATDARRDAIALDRAVSALRDAAEAVRVAALTAQYSAVNRANALAKAESTIA